MNKMHIVKAVALIVMTCASHSAAVHVSIYGGPTYQSTGIGYQSPILQHAPGSSAGNGVGVGTASRYSNGILQNQRAIRWDAEGWTELGNLPGNPGGSITSTAYAINHAGMAVGSVQKPAGGANSGTRAVRWNAGAAGVISATELGNLGVNSTTGSAINVAYAINNHGTTVGFAEKYGNGFGNDAGTRAVRWEAGSTVATELGNLGTNGNHTQSRAYAVNSSGAAVGFAQKYSSTELRGSLAVRWDAGSTVATQLGHLSTDNNLTADCAAYAVNDQGTAIGYSRKYNGATNLGQRAVRWDAGTTTITELGNLGTSNGGYTLSFAYSINSAGTAVGYAHKYVDGLAAAHRAVRWNADTTTATELGALTTSSPGIPVTSSIAYAINQAGIAVGYDQKSFGGMPSTRRAVYWNLDGIATDLNTLLSDADRSHWFLQSAWGISDTGWITGIGRYSAIGSGSGLYYDRLFMIQIPDLPAGAFALAGILAARRRRS